MLIELSLARSLYIGAIEAAVAFHLDGAMKTDKH